MKSAWLILILCFLAMAPTMAYGQSNSPSIQKTGQAVSHNTVQNAVNADIIEQLDLIAQRIIALGKMRVDNRTQIKDKTDANANIKNSIKKLLENENIDDKTKTLLNTVQTELGKPITMRSPDGKKERGKNGSEGHCNKLAKMILDEIKRLKGETK